MSSDHQETTSGQGEPDENKEDFRLLARQQSKERSASSSASRATSSSSGRSLSATNDMVWPLQLTANFVDNYIIGDVIGHGSYAEVRECVDTRTLERCALKIVNKSYLNRQAPRALANQLLEIRLLRRLEHPSVIKMRECLYRGDCIYIALEYCAFSLDEILAEQPGNCLQPSIARSFFVQLCTAVAYLHTIGIVHRDIKPENILFTTAGLLKLIDFGVSQILSIWQTRDLCSNYEGSPLFQAPEVVSGQREYLGCKVDVWACGVTLYLTLYGQYPFMDEALLGLYDKILADNLSIPPEAPATCLALTDLLAHMLSKNCERRATIEQVLAHPWCQLLETATNDCEPSEPYYSDFFDLVVVGRHNVRACGEKSSSSSQIYASSQQRDMYKSMSCLPYLYKHHFPELPIVKSTRRRSVLRVNQISPSASLRSSQSGASSASSSTIATEVPADQGANEDDAQANHEVEWGTREQYQLMKVPQVRANRIRCGRPRSRRRRRRQRHATRRRNREQPRPGNQ